MARSSAQPARAEPRPRSFTARDHLLVALGGLVALVVCGLVVRDGEVGSVERDVFQAVNDLPDWLYRPLWLFQQFGNFPVAVVLGVVVALLLRRWKVAIAVVVAAAGKLWLETVVKSVVERRRPGTSIGDVHLRGKGVFGLPRDDVPTDTLSFVSGHAVITAAVAGLLTPILPGRWKILPWVLVALNGLARIYVGAHNPLDILGGIGLGLVIAGVLNAALLIGRRPNRVSQGSG